MEYTSLEGGPSKSPKQDVYCLKIMVTHVTLLDEQLSAQEEFLAEWHSPIMLATPATLSRLAPTSSILS